MPSSSGCGWRAFSVFQPMCGIFRLGVVRRDAVDLAGNPAEALDHLVFAAALGHQLHADADAEERPALAGAPSRSAPRPCRRPHRARGGNPRRRRRRAAPRGRRARTVSGIVGHHDRLIRAGLARRALEGFRRRVQIARAVVDDRDGHGRASGCGNSPTISDDGRPRERRRAAEAARPARVARRARPSRRRSAARRPRDRRRPRRRAVEAAARELPAPQARRLHADQQRQQQRRPSSRRSRRRRAGCSANVIAARSAADRR